MDRTATLQTLVLILAVAGFGDALYFTLAYYGRIRKAKWVPAVLCPPEGSSCVKVVRTPYARVLGVPNSLLGILYYVFLMWWSGSAGPVGVEMEFGGRYHILHFQWLIILVSLGTVVLAGYLIYALHVKLRVNCPLCHAAHAINVALLVLLVALTS